MRLPLKLSLSQNGLVLEEIRGILRQPKNVQTASQISPVFATPRCLLGRQLRLTPNYQVKGVLARRKATIEVIAQPKRASTRGGM